MMNRNKRTRQWRDAPRRADSGGGGPEGHGSDPGLQLFVARRPLTPINQDDIKQDDQLHNHLGLALLKAAKKGDAVIIQLLLDIGAPVNFVDPIDHVTALHYVAAYDAHRALKVLLKSGKCDFLVRGWAGRLPSEIAREYGRDREMARRLLVEEMRQAREQGIDPGNLYKISARGFAP
jgi:ankyrin repeat protein